MKKILKPDFFDRPTLVVARELLGKCLVRRVGGRDIAFKIVETEAYGGLHDLASHSRSGVTPRNAPMFAEPGTIYVYFTYGMHWMLNLVCGKKGHPAAVLIRGVQAIQEIPAKKSSGRPSARTSTRLFSPKFLVSLNGPAKLTKFLKIDKTLNAHMLGKKVGLWVEDRGPVKRDFKIKRTPRIGVEYAGLWAKKPWRFVLQEKKKLRKH